MPSTHSGNPVDSESHFITTVGNQRLSLQLSGGSALRWLMACAGNAHSLFGPGLEQSSGREEQNQKAHLLPSPSKRLDSCLCAGKGVGPPFEARRPFAVQNEPTLTGSPEMGGARVTKRPLLEPRRRYNHACMSVETSAFPCQNTSWGPSCSNLLAENNVHGGGPWTVGILAKTSSSCGLVTGRLFPFCKPQGKRAPWWRSAPWLQKCDSLLQKYRGLAPVENRSKTNIDQNQR